MKILFILPSLANKGPIIVVKDIIERLNFDNVSEIKVFFFDDIREVVFRCPVQRISFNEKIDFDHFDIIHTHMFRPDLYIFKNKILGNIKRAKTISTLHQYNYINLQYDFKSKFIAFFVSKVWNVLLLKYDHVVCLSDDMKKYYQQQLIFNKKISYIYNGRATRNLNEVTIQDEIFGCIPNNSIIIGTSCLLTARKGLEQVINIMPKIENLYFIILGNGVEEDNLKTLANDLKVNERCKFMGFKSNPFDYYKFFDIFVLPSRGEGFPLALLEAASMKKAILSSNLSICEEAFTKEEIVFFELDNSEDLKNKILYAYENKVKFENNVYKKFLNSYTSQIMSENYLNLYQGLLNAKN